MWPLACAGVGAPRASEPAAGLLGRAAADSVWGLAHGGRYLAGDSALLDRDWARPVRAGWRRWQRWRAEGCTWARGSFRGFCTRRYQLPVVVGPRTDQTHNPELGLDTSGPDVPTRRRRLLLRSATARMRAAALGQDLDMQDAGEARHLCPRAPPTARGPTSHLLVLIHFFIGHFILEFMV